MKKNNRVIDFQPTVREAPLPQGSIASHLKAVISALGEEPDRDGLRSTPQRAEKALRFLTSGYTADIEKVVNGALFGLFAYGTYDLTNQATLKVWSTTITLADMAWGATLTAIAASAGFVAARGFARRRDA